MKLGIHIGELGILTIGSPSQLLNSPSSPPPPRQPIPSSPKENSVEGALPSQQNSSLQVDHPKDIPLPHLHSPLLPQNDNSIGGLPHLPLPNTNLDNGAPKSEILLHKNLWKSSRLKKKIGLRHKISR